VSVVPAFAIGALAQEAGSIQGRITDTQQTAVPESQGDHIEQRRTGITFCV
jgi:hypothetical protein